MRVRGSSNVTFINFCWPLSGAEQNFILQLNHGLLLTEVYLEEEYLALDSHFADRWSQSCQQARDYESDYEIDVAQSCEVTVSVSLADQGSQLTV